MGTIEITISNWDKYNDKSHNLKKPWWFKLNNSFLSDPDFYTFTSDEKLIWIQILCQASQQKTKSITIHFESYYRMFGFTEKMILSAIGKLMKIHSIKSQVTEIRPESGPNPASIGFPDKNRLDKKIIHAQVFDFERLYLEHYPRKNGKKKGIEQCEKVIKTKEQYEQLEQGIKNYAKANRTTPKDKIKHFSSFMNQDTWLEFQNEKPKVSNQHVYGMDRPRLSLVDGLPVQPRNEDAESV